MAGGETLKNQISMKQIVEQDLKPIMVNLFRRVKEGGTALVIDGTPAYNDKAQFVGGKIINEACYTSLELLKTEESRRDLREMIRMAAGMKMETWGILNAITGLYRLKTAGLLEQAADPETLALLEKALDWRTFVDVENHYALIRKPTNYYGVAFGIARYRELMGWEPERHSRRLLDRLLEHIDRYSKDLCFMDETPGDGRFDRYSILVPSELTSQLLATGWEVPDKIRTMLGKSARIFLQLANEEGQGFAYGRSIGAYGDTAALEVLAAAAELGGILTDEELEIAYGYSVRILKRMVDFWYDKEMDSFNLWEHGRRTDSYRNKNRILGENLSLCMQMVNTYEHWVRAGYGEHKACSDYAERLNKLEAYTYIPFARGSYERGLAIIRDGRHIWSLPIINGGRKYYDKDAYMPVPFQNGVLQGVPGCNHGQLMPQIIMENGEVYLPSSYIRTIRTKTEADRMEIVYTMDGLCRMGRGIFISKASAVNRFAADDSLADADDHGNSPQRVDGITGKTRYVFEKSQICREDVFTFPAGQKVREVRLVFLTYSEAPLAEGCTVRFGRGAIIQMQTAGYESCQIKAATDDGSYDTPQGRLNTEVVWSRKEIPDDEELSLSWTIRYV